MTEPNPPTHPAVADTVRWLERAVIGLNLCPFAKAPHVKGQIHYQVSQAKGLEGLRDELMQALQDLAALPAEVRETTLLIVPHMLHDFLDFNDFLDEADGALHELGLEGEFQMASFHPSYQFAGTEADDITNFTNRSPHPTLHLIREASMDKAVAAYPEAAEIYERNMDVLRRLGHAGLSQLLKAP